MRRIASLVWSSVFGLMSVMAIREQPERANPFATAAPMPDHHEHGNTTSHKIATYQFLQRL